MLLAENLIFRIFVTSLLWYLPLEISSNTHRLQLIFPANACLNHQLFCFYLGLMPAEYNCVHDGSITIDWYCLDLYRLRKEIIPWAICINVKLKSVCLVHVRSFHFIFIIILPNINKLMDAIQLFLSSPGCLLHFRMHDSI